MSRIFSAFGNAIKSLRKSAGLGLGRASRLLGVSRTYLYRVELGELGPFSEKVIRKAVRELGGDFLELMLLAKRIPSRVKNFLLSEPELLAALYRQANRPRSEHGRAKTRSPRRPPGRRQSRAKRVSS